MKNSYEDFSVQSKEVSDATLRNSIILDEGQAVFVGRSVKKHPCASFELKRELKEKIERMRLLNLNSTIEKKWTKAERKLSGAFIVKKLDVQSQNFVGRIEEPQMLSWGIVKRAHLHFSDEYRQELKSYLIAKKLVLFKKVFEFEKCIANEFVQVIQNAVFKHEYLKEIFDYTYVKSIEILEKILNHNKIVNKREFYTCFFEIKECVYVFKKSFDNLTLENFPVYYDRFDIIQKMKMLIFYNLQGESIKAELSVIGELIEILEKKTGIWISHSEIQEELSVVQNMIDHSESHFIKKIKSRQFENAYISSIDLQLIYQNSDFADNVLKLCSSSPGFAVKEGLENSREYLFAKIAKLISNNNVDYSQYMVIKTPFSFTNTPIEALQAKEYNMSSWVWGGMIDSDSWYAFQSVRSGLANALLKGQNASVEQEAFEYAKKWIKFEWAHNELRSRIDQLKEAIDDSEEQITGFEDILAKSSYAEDQKIYIDNELAILKKELTILHSEYIEVWNEVLQPSKSVMYHGVIDLLLGSLDSHLRQYVLDENGSAINIDFARFGAPAEVARKDGEHKAILRSIMLTHPDASIPLPEEIIENLKLFNEGEFEKKLLWSGLVGSEQEFRRAGEAMQELFDEWALADRMENFGFLCTKYRFHLKCSQNPPDPERLKRAIEKEIVKIQKQCFPKLHPKAYQSIKSRFKKAKAYLEGLHEEKPTLETLRDAIYPEFKPFLEFLKCTGGNETERLSVKYNEFQESRYRSLESILEYAAEKVGGKEYPEEKYNQMLDAFEILKSKALPWAELSLAMNV